MQIASQSSFAKLSPSTAVKNYLEASHKGILKIMSKMGISAIQSYRGAQIFEAVGLSETVIGEYFTGTPSRIGGINIEEIESEALQRHHSAFGEDDIAGNMHIKPGGQYQWRRDGEHHMWNPKTIASLQHAVRNNTWESYEEFADFVDNENKKLSTIRGLLDFKIAQTPIDISEVDPA